MTNAFSTASGTVMPGTDGPQVPVTRIRTSSGREHHSLAPFTHENGVTVLRFPGFDEACGVRHAFSTRLGGVSTGCYESMNLSFTRGDDEACVLENFRRMAAVVAAKPEDVVCTFQTHTVNIRVVTKEDAGKGVVKERDYTDIDGLVTDDPSVVLTVFYADCVPLLFADPVRHVIGTAHAGWRGSTGGIGKNMVNALKEHYGSKPENLHVAIGPSICAPCYEVGEEVVAQVREALAGSGVSVSEDGVSEKTPLRVFYQREHAPAGKWQLDLHALNRLLLAEAGIPEDHIFVTDVCTKCNPHLLFSYRVMGEKRGNLSAFLRIAENT